VVDATPVAVSINVTVAPGDFAPEGSLTNPVTVAVVVVCALKADCEKTRKATSSIEKNRFGK
jgi:hypothetical protein